MYLTSLGIAYLVFWIIDVECVLYHSSSSKFLYCFQQRAIEEEARRLEEKKRQEEELAEFERRKQGKRRRQRKQRPEEELPSFFHRYGRFILGPLLVILLAMFMFYLFNT